MSRTDWTDQAPDAGRVLERDLALDGLRGVAVGMILLLHGFNFAPGNIVTRALHATTASLYIGVDLFFVLSGFLITSILIRTRDQPRYFRNFYARRALRIFPAYYVVLAVCYALRPLSGDPTAQAQMDADAPWYLFYLQNLLMALRGRAGVWNGLDPTWSLAIEEQFYLLWPAVVWLTPQRHLLRVCLVAVTASVAAKLAMHAAGVPMWTQYVTTFSHAEGLALGAAIGAFLHEHRGARPPRWLRFAGAVAGGYLIVVHPSWERQHVLHILVVSVFFGWLLFETVAASPQALLRRALESAPLTLLGRYSYGVYLIHYPVLTLIGAHFWSTWKTELGVNQSVLLSGTLMTLVTLLLAVAMYHGIEAPALRLKRLFAPTGPRAASGAALRE